MRRSSRVQGLAWFVFGFALLGWLLYDAGHVQRALGLEALVSEVAVALAGLLVAAIALGAGIFHWCGARRLAGSRDAGQAG